MTADSKIKSGGQLASVVFGAFGQSDREFEFSCDIHGKYTGHKFQMPNGRVVDEPCKECQEEAEAKRIAREQAEARQAHLERSIERSGIPLRYQSRTLDNFKVTCDGQRRALAVCKDYAENFEESYRDGRCMIFSGGTGSGKTHLATAIANHVIRSGHSATFTSVREIVGKVRATWRKGSDKTEEDVISAYGGVGLLIIDEIGVQFDSDAERLVMFDVINRRYEDMMPTIVISNLPLDAENGKACIRSTLGDRVIDRLRENGGKMIAFDWGSYRKNAEANQ